MSENTKPRGCGRREVIGHGQNHFCGDELWGEVVYCDSCNLKAAKARIGELEAALAALEQQPKAQAGGAVADAPDPTLCAFYGVDSWPALVAAQEEHVLKLQDAARRNVKPWEDTFPPTLLPKYLRDSGLAAAEPATRTVVIHTTTPPAPVVPEVGIERREWMACESRAPWAANSLKRRAEDMRCGEKRCRNAFKKDWMGETARFVADAYKEAAEAFERRLAAMLAAAQQPGEG